VQKSPYFQEKNGHISPYLDIPSCRQNQAGIFKKSTLLSDL